MLSFSLKVGHNLEIYFFSSSVDVPSTTVKSFSTQASNADPHHPDNSFREYRKLCARIADVSSYLAKTREVADFLKKGSDGSMLMFL